MARGLYLIYAVLAYVVFFATFLYVAFLANVPGLPTSVAAPVMTIGHLLFAIGMTAYILIAIRIEERDLVDLCGRDYVQYRQRVGMLAPKLGRGRKQYYRLP